MFFYAFYDMFINLIHSVRDMVKLPVTRVKEGTPVLLLFICFCVYRSANSFGIASIHRNLGEAKESIVFPQQLVQHGLLIFLSSSATPKMQL